MSEAVKRYTVGDCYIIGGSPEMLECSDGEYALAADHDRMIYGHKSEASYQLGELPELIQSSREECRPDDLRRAIDAALEACQCS